MPSASVQRVVAQIYALLGRPGLQKLPPDDVKAARIAAGMEILRAIAGNPLHSDYGSLITLVTVAHNAFLPAHDGEPGIPVIIPFDGADARDGYPADPDQIDSWRADVADSPLYSGALDGTQAGHNQQSNGRMSPVACRYSIAAGRFKFTGLSAQIPLIQLTRTMADTGVPENYEPTIVRLSVPRLVKPNEPFYQLAREMGADGKQDLVEIMGGAMKVRPLSQPNIVTEQKQSI
jgi:hypothetical protein